LGALSASDVSLKSYSGASLIAPHIVARYLDIALVRLIGLALQHCASLKTLLPASIGGSTVFYLITNSFSWLSDPGYVKNFGGLIQALTVGLPEYSSTPTWMFFRNSLVSDLFFTLLFVACMHFWRKTSRACAGAGLPRVASFSI